MEGRWVLPSIAGMCGVTHGEDGIVVSWIDGVLMVTGIDSKKCLESRFLVTRCKCMHDTNLQKHVKATFLLLFANRQVQRTAEQN